MASTRRRRMRSGEWTPTARASASCSDESGTPFARITRSCSSAHAHALGSSAAVEEIHRGARSLRRRVCRAPCRDPRMGRARVPQGDHRLGTRKVFRDHLMSALRSRSLHTRASCQGPADKCPHSRTGALASTSLERPERNSWTPRPSLGVTTECKVTIEIDV